MSRSLLLLLSLLFLKLKKKLIKVRQTDTISNSSRINSHHRYVMNMSWPVHCQLGVDLSVMRTESYILIPFMPTRLSDRTVFIIGVYDHIIVVLMSLATCSTITIWLFCFFFVVGRINKGQISWVTKIQQLQTTPFRFYDDDDDYYNMLTFKDSFTFIYQFGSR